MEQPPKLFLKNIFNISALWLGLIVGACIGGGVVLYYANGVIENLNKEIKGKDAFIENLQSRKISQKEIEEHRRKMDAENPPNVIDVSCTKDTDCAINKNLRNACGPQPQCVNVNSVNKTNIVPSAAAGICGFKEVSGCKCVNNTCTDISP